MFRRTRLPEIGVAFALNVLLLAASAGEARADLLTLNPGVKLGYTFGHGFTFGTEVSLTWTKDGLGWIMGEGVVVDLTWTKGLFEARLGGEIYGPLYGIEAGPAIVVGPTTYLAIDVTPWLGSIVVPYYTTSIGIGGPSWSEVGTYLKLPICLHDTPKCPEGHAGGHHDWHD